MIVFSFQVFVRQKIRKHERKHKLKKVACIRDKPKELISMLFYLFHQKRP